MTQSVPRAQREASGIDLAPLSWVLPDLRKSLPLAIIAARQYFLSTKEVDTATGAVIQRANLQEARRLFHQARSALEMIGLHLAAKLIAAGGETIQAFSDSTLVCSEESIGSLEKSQLAILDYLEALLKGKNVQALGLFPQYRVLLERLKVQRIHPADLWLEDWYWQDIPLAQELPTIALTQRLKVQWGQAVLKFLNSADADAASELKDACASLAGSGSSSSIRTFWMLCSGFFEACQYRLIPLDVYVKRTISQILQHLNAAFQEGLTVSDTVAKDAAFFCMQARLDDLPTNPYLSAIQAAYGALDRPSGDYNVPQYGRFDPVQVDFLRRRLTGMSESWSALCGGDLGRGSSVLEHLAAVADALQKLTPECDLLVRTLQGVIDDAIKPGAVPNSSLAMEVATTLLYLEAVYDDIDPAADTIGDRMDTLARRLAQVSNGEAPAAVESWMEALYRRLSERQSMGSVTSELRTTLAAVETAMEQYLRDPLDSSILAMVSGHLSQMYGVFSVLGLQQAANAVFKIREVLDKHLSTEKRNRPIPIQVYEQIARSVSTMGFLIDMLSYQIAIAKEMFVYDEQAGEFSYLNGRGTAQKKLVIPLRAKAAVRQAEESASSASITAKKQEPIQSLSNLDRTEAGKAIQSNDLEDDGAEILDIFLDEAAAVLQESLQVFTPLLADAVAFEDLLLVRRAFHTLKGGARMVGLDALGEAAWAFEQLLHQWMAEKQQPTQDFLDLITQTLTEFSNWSQSIRQGITSDWNESAFRDSADAMRLQGRLVPIRGSTSKHPSTDGASQLSPEKTDAEPNGSFVITGDAMANNSPSADAPVSDPLSVRTRAAQSDVTPGPPAINNDLSLMDAISTEMDASSTAEQVLPDPIAGTAMALLPAAFFEIFVSETRDWAVRLCEHVLQWHGFLHAPELQAGQDLAHSIRGNAAAVGMQEIADLAQAMEEALGHLLGDKQTPIPHTSVFEEAATSLLAMVESCAAGRALQSDASLLRRLNALQLDMPAAFVIDGISTEVVISDSASTNSLDEVNSGIFVDSDQSLTLAPITVDTGQMNRTSNVQVQVEIEDDPLDSQDQLDIDLLPFFQEECAELIPTLGTALRQWVEHPDEVTHRATVLRTLHTLKGSGRLAGAFRLGELAHRIESGIEKLPARGLTRSQLEPFLAHFDRLQSIFAVLGQGSEFDPQVPGNGLAPRADEGPDRELATTPTSAVPAQRTLPALLTGLIRVRASVVERLVDQAGEVAVYRSRTQSHLGHMGVAMGDLSQTLDRLTSQLRELELQADMRIQSRNTTAGGSAEQFDPLEFDRFTTLQEIVRMMAEAVGDVSTVRRNVQTSLLASQQDLEQQSRQLRELQRDLLRMRLVDFEVIADRLYSVVRQAAKELEKQVSLDLEGGKIELDRSVLERMTPSFEHLLRNAVVHGIETTSIRLAAGKSAVGAIKVAISQVGNDIAIDVIDDGGGLHLAPIKKKAVSLGLIASDQELDEDAAVKLLFTPGFSTAGQVTELAGRGIGLDVVLSEVNALGGRIETQFIAGQGTSFKLVLPLTTAVTHVLIFRVGKAHFGVPAGLVETVIRASSQTLDAAYAAGELTTEQGQTMMFYGSSALLQVEQAERDLKSRTLAVLILRSAGQALALHIDEVLGNREVVVKNMGPQLSRLPGLAGITVLPSGETILIYNPIALANVHGSTVRQLQTLALQSVGHEPGSKEVQAPLILVVDDALTVRRVLQRLLVREGYRVALANDGVHALQLLEQQRPLMVLSDIEMPRMDGFELARSIRARPEHADLPIVMITSRIAQKHRDHALSLGVNHYLGKPYSEAGLLGLIRDQVEISAASTV